MANNIKLARYESIITETINRAIVFEVSNKVAKLGRITYCKLGSDLSICKAYVECVDRERAPEIAHALNSISGLFRSKVSQALDIYKTPKIIFEIDKSIDYAENIDKIIRSIKKEEN
ncbi:MAG: 30S ribosome-binding factor RbfA [Mycoplasma sp.]